MNTIPFDRFARALAGFFGRRTVAQWLFGLSLAALATGAEFGATDVDAKKNKKKKRRGRKKKKKNTCKPDCTGKTCGPNGCDGNCGTCAGTETCLAGACANICDVCATDCTFDNVSLAIAQARPGATIILCPETFSGPAGVGVGKEVTLVGAGADPSETILSRGGAGPTFSVQNGSTLTVRNLTITGAAGGGIGGILNSGTLRLESVHVVDNTGATAGGGINNQFGELTLVDSLVQGNDAQSGGGIKNEGGNVTLIRTVVEGNQAETGGGIDNTQGTVNLTDDSSVTGNMATGGVGSGGGILNADTVSIDGSSSVEGNDPDDCVDSGSGDGCPS
ncbi:MAG: hypothetical protein K0Q71_2312 [Thermomicrobiales bacterium]|nr:hypothetical protein [Thermomicrobiales bacterium]